MRAALNDRLAAAQRDPVLIDAAIAMQRGDLATAERLLKDRLRTDHADIAALRMLGELVARVGRLPDAQDLFARALLIAPGFTAARRNYAAILHRRNLLAEALVELDILLADDPDEPATLTIKAAVLARAGEYPAAIALYERVLARHPDQGRLWMSMGHALKTVGRQDDSVAAYRRALAIEPDLGEAWWSLANLKTVRFGPGDIDVMLAAAARARATADQLHLHYALGKAFEDAADYRRSFEHYSTGARLRRAEMPYDGARTARHLERSKRAMTREALAVRAGQGCPDPAPIFVVGLPRSGSTLVEQILASHSQVEGTMELSDLNMVARKLGAAGGEPDDYLDRLLAADADALFALGQEYLDRTRIQRKTDRPFFIDKMPSNFEHIGLIRLILPNAKIIDTRRHPMANCFAAFKQHFSRGQRFSYSLDDLGAYYLDYVALMDHYDNVVPGAVHRVFYETMVTQAEREIRRLLAFCGLPFEAACLQFHQTVRPVRTASSEQVRQPLHTAAIDQWHHYRPWLASLDCVLKDTVVRYKADRLQSA
ncbi:tetratricopeptide repeat-containing sulfotransferase family protein [Sphingomonas bacterium]|uniref:tetratricopeptide repeat-containing sulfotransferase family protein n=1 Tax=Sphingomonas bacterium TaxID=1895847 RepID=UPI001C2D9FAE|nr:sulfotransferase [Sphingomonas bacterium]